MPFVIYTFSLCLILSKFLASVNFMLTNTDICQNKVLMYRVKCHDPHCNLNTMTMNGTVCFVVIKGDNISLWLSLHFILFHIGKSFFRKRIVMLNCIPTTSKEINVIIQSLKNKTYMNVMKYVMK